MITKNDRVLSDQELAEAHVLPHGLDEFEKSLADDDLRQLRLLRLKGMSDQQKIFAGILQLKYQMEDYVNEGAYEKGLEFGAFLQRYLKVLNKKQVDFATEVSLHHTKISQLLHGKAEPNLSLVYRLEKHSGGLIPAILWWKVQAKKTEAEIRIDQAGRRREANKVNFQVTLLPEK